jgi:hypothetical protein
MSFDAQQPVALTYRDRPIRLAGVTCGRCDNDFFVQDQPEHQPRFCAYCGWEFRRYVDPEGETRNMAGGK